MKKNIFYVHGIEIGKDNKAIVVSKNELEDIIYKVKLVNEKYGVIKRWRARKREYYYHINNNFCIYETLECYTKDDNKRYELGNYFQTKEEAQKVLDSIQWKDLWKDVREDRLKFGV